MFTFSRILRILILTLILLPGIVLAQSSFKPLTYGIDSQFQQTLAGYGRIQVWQINTSLSGSRAWLVDCENDANAQLLQAKFLSDAQNHPNGGQTFKQQQTQCFMTASGHGIGAVRVKNMVCLFTLDDPRKLSNFARTLASDAKCNQADLQWASDTKVPMYLDRFDQHGFRFYYRPFELPSKDVAETYDPITEFDYAKEHGDLGFVFWNSLNPITTGEGFMNHGWWSWGLEAAAKRNLPVQVNTGMSYHAPNWLSNLHPQAVTDKMPQFVGGMHRIADPHLGGQGVVLMGDNVIRRSALALIQKDVTHFSKLDNITSYLEPYGEVHHGQQDLFLDFGPQVDKAYSQWLMERYHNLNVLNLRWYGQQTLKQWTDVKFPEVAYFFGYNEQSHDLQGTWKLQFSDSENPCPDEWYKPDFDDSKWGTLTAPGDDHTMFLPKKPAVYRRHFDLPKNYKQSGKRVWLYLWDLTDKQRLTITIDLNGKRISKTQSMHTFPHWVAVDVTDQIKDTNNFVALGLPRGFMAYRMYLSHEAPQTYPQLGKHRNAQWVDFMDFVTARRAANIKMGLQMIRQVDTKRPITMMAPDYVADTLKDYASQYNGNFHNTGYMGGFWADYLPMLMRGVDRPMTVEPGGPAKDGPGMEKQLGLWFSEGVNAIDYFIHIGSVIWHDDIREKFEHYLPMIHTLGTYHQPKAQIAQLISSRVNRLTGFPWQQNSDLNLPSGYWRWNLSSSLSNDYRIDAVCESDFGSDVTSAYKLVVDTNTTILSEQDVAGIEQWVRKGGIFVTFVQTGRHTPEHENAWPISRLSGYEVLSCDATSQVIAGKIQRAVKLSPNAGDYKMPRALLSAKGAGLRLKPTSTDCQDLLLWEDGSVAMGLRKLGDGYVVHIGANFSKDRLWFGNPTASVEIVRSAIEYFDMSKLRGSAPGVRFRHFVSNNGLYDHWVLWNESNGKAMTKLDIYDHNPGQALEVLTGNYLPLSDKKHGSRLANLILEPNELRMYRTARQSQADAPAQWLGLQRAWWKASHGDTGKPFDAPTYPNTLHLTDGWQPTNQGNVWPSKLQVFDNETSQAKENVQTYTRTFTVPKDWTNGRVLFWMHSWIGHTFIHRARVELDGKQLQDWHPNGMDGWDMTDKLKPGSTHTLSVQLKSDKPLIGMRGETWLHYLPKPDATIDLAGEWEFSNDVINFDRKLKLPGHWSGLMARRTVDIPANLKDKQTFIRIDNNSRVVGAIVNGHWLRSHHHAIGHEFDINITKLVHYGQTNQITLVHYNDVGHCEVKKVELYFQN